MAGVAALFGLHPITYLALSPEDAQITDAALTEASRLFAERTQGFLDYLVGTFAGG